jgi:hypothetical protein
MQTELNNLPIQKFLLDSINKLKSTFILKFKLLFLVSTLGGILGVTYSFIKSPKYQSDITFLVEESKAGGGGLLSSLGSQIGVDVTSITGSGNSVISGDNMLELLKSKSMMKECLMTPFQNDSNYLLADRYADIYKLKTKWSNDNEIAKIIHFNDVKVGARIKDSLLSSMIKMIHKKEFNVSKPDKKLGFFKVTVETKDELLSAHISERIIKIATNFYVNNKTSRLKNNVARLEHRTDSIGNLLNNLTYSSVNDAKLMLNLNPAEVDAQGTAEISERDKIVLSTIYAELIKNLEISKTALVQETPTIQITDKSILPLEKNELKWYEGLLIGFIVPFLFLFVIFAI